MITARRSRLVEVIGEVPAGDVNGENTIFATQYQYRQGTPRVYLNGVRLRAGSDNDYTLGEGRTNVILKTPPSSGDVVLVDYIRE